MNTASEITASIHAHARELGALGESIWDHPELAFHEEYACAALADYLAGQGFHIQKNIAGLSTAFTAAFGSGRPVIGFLGEYDALPGLSQAAGTARRRERSPGGPGHGCGHNLLGVGAAGAAVAVKEYLQKAGRAGTVFFFGCPAEESGAGKAVMAGAGAFDGLDACFIWHPDTHTCVVGTPSLANVILRARFQGRASHAAAAPELGRSALDACELMNVGANYLREHVPASVRFHYAYSDCGGSSPNTVPETAELQYYVRARRIDQAREIAERLHKIARGAALMTETRLTWKTECEMFDYVPNHALSRILDEALQQVGPPAFTDAEMAEAAVYARPGGEPLDRAIEPYAPSSECRSVSSDVGNISYLVPTAQVFVASFAKGTAFHTWQMTAQSRRSAAQKGMLTAAGAMALAGAWLLDEPSRLEAVRREWSMRSGGHA